MTPELEREGRALALLLLAMEVQARRRAELAEQTQHMLHALDRYHAAQDSCERASELVADAMLHLVHVAPHRAFARGGEA